MLIRRIDATRLDDCLALAAGRKWSAEPHKWGLLFEIGDVYGIDDPDGGLAGCVVCTSYGTRLSGIGMMLVAEKFGRQGLGGQLMKHAMAEAGTESTWLTATTYGQPLYEKLGFRSIGDSYIYRGEFRPPASGASRPASTKDMAAIAALDAEVFGAPRPEVLGRLPVFTEQLRVIEGTEGIRGYAAAWRNVDDTVIGPVVADNETMAKNLISDLAAGISTTVRLDLDDTHPELREWVEGLGIARGMRTEVMVHGASLPGDRKRLFLPLSVATG
ncbi:GNAT family N-acetyltransferase [Kibdelosporangium philippinense]|uniref:GNAT family N-acetyltransferase n=1 Tax=Kibdelosporangium philippinense TaxID=211113 RepID=A0ABS8ZVU8_9PSEU|nr:GNAT family N-acetyltransferase [Kibdelosporangium philippinense]MCE7011850.1 GNAT family N-acetyltransferase [Kibdelosporangium philippinense]